MTEKRKLEFFVLRYVPDAVKEEFVNIGLVMFEPGANGPGFAEVRFTRDWRRVRCLDPQVDVGLLLALQKDIRAQLAEVRDRETLIRRLQDSFSNLVQLSGVKGCMSANPAAELALLTRYYLKRRVAAKGEPLELEPEPEPRHGVGRHFILGEMQESFERAGVWKLLMKRIPVFPYTHPKDPFKFDFGYRVGGEIKLFHAVSLSTKVDAAVLLAARFQKIAPKMAQMTSAASILTAVVEHGLDRSKDEVGFALEMMEESRIRVAETSEMAGIAEEARVDLRV
jgi:hypothetical protein